MKKGSLTLADYPGDMVRLGCTRCPRQGQYRKATLVARYGENIPLPSLCNLIAQCPRHGAWGNACGVFYRDLAPRR